MLLYFSVDSLLKLPELSQPLSSSMKVFHDKRRSWLWGLSILMTIPQSFSVTIGYSVRYSLQKGKGETFCPNMHSVHQTGRDSLLEAGVIYHLLYPLGGLSSPHIPNINSFPSFVLVVNVIALFLLVVWFDFALCEIFLRWYRENIFSPQVQRRVGERERERGGGGRKGEMISLISGLMK